MLAASIARRSGNPFVHGAKKLCMTHEIVSSCFFQSVTDVSRPVVCTPSIPPVRTGYAPAPHTVRASPVSRSNELRTLNRHRVLRMLRRLGPCSRHAIGQATDLSAAAISSYAAELVAEGVVGTQRTAGSRGRPQSTLSLSAGAASAITLSLTIDRLIARLIDNAGTTHATLQRDLDTRTLNAAELVDEVLRAIDTLAAHPCAIRLRQVSIGFQGVVAHARGALVWSPILSVGNVPLGEAIERHSGLAVSVHNDCRLMAAALHADHGERLGAHFATVLFSHGVGLALTLDGEPFDGAINSALEFGHLTHVPGGAPCRCGRAGCIEAYAADYAIVRAVGGASDASGATALEAAGRVSNASLERAAVQAARGDPSARRAFAQAGTAIGTGLDQLFLLVGTMPVALVGRSRTALEAMRPSLLDAVHAVASPHEPVRTVQVITFPDDDVLFQQGLTLDALTALDRQLASAPANATDARTCIP